MKLAIVKIHMIGSPVLILGISQYGHEWDVSQLFTAEDFKGFVEEEYFEKLAAKYHGTEVKFDSVPVPVKILQRQHDFNLSEAESVNISGELWPALRGEIADDGWVEFDLETWGK